MKTCLFYQVFFTLIFIGMCSPTVAQNYTTHYYKQIKVVTKDRKEQKGNESGQFVTFNNKVCYDSDKSGYTVNNGSLKFGKSTADRVYYSGDSYWGRAMYIFTENYDRLNIIVEESGITYVYVLATPPSNAYTCSLIKEANPNATNSSVANPIPPVIGVGNGRETSTPTSRQKYITVEETCHICHGSGKCNSCNGTRVWYPTYTQEATVCTVCTNGKCWKCGGSGKVLKGEWITVYK